MLMEAALVVWVMTISLFDWRQQRVPNAALILVLVPAVLALLVQGQGLLQQGAMASGLGMVFGFALTFPGYSMRRFGAGDVKFAAVLGLLLGGWRAAEMVLWASLLLGLMAAVVWWMRESREAKFPAAPALGLAFVVEMVSGPLLLKD